MEALAVFYIMCCFEIFYGLADSIWFVIFVCCRE